MARSQKAKSQGGKAKAGRPTAYTDKIGSEICNRLADGESLRAICKSDKIPSKTSVFRWLLSDGGEYNSFRDQYTLARRIQAESRADELFDISDDGTNDYMERNDPENGGYAVNGESIGRSRLRVDTRKWYLSKLLPKVYGDKVELGGSTSVTHNIMPVPVADSIESWEEVAKKHQDKILGS